MPRLRPLALATAFSAALLGPALLAAPPARAQSAACVNLLAGAGYAAWMGVKFGDSYYWSDSFPIGQYRCVKLPVSGMVDNAPYTVVVSAVLGSSKVPCKQAPSPYNSKDSNSVVYNAWGTTLNVSCEMPTAAANAMAVKGDEPPPAK
ncbi:MAG: hypothetical protein JSR72_13000 [Proteobacteria bacterium]|nr:hypothetical protein [Pseudomonadota bacterium]